MYYSLIKKNSTCYRKNVNALNLFHQINARIKVPEQYDYIALRTKKKKKKVISGRFSHVMRSLADLLAHPNGNLRVQRVEAELLLQ